MGRRGCGPAPRQGRVLATRILPQHACRVRVKWVSLQPCTPCSRDACLAGACAAWMPRPQRPWMDLQRSGKTCITRTRPTTITRTRPASASHKHGRRRVRRLQSRFRFDEPSRMSDAERKAKVAVKVVPRASRDEVVGWLGDRLKIKIAAPPQDGRANDALEAFLAERLGVPRRSVRVAAGHGSTSKIVEIDGVGEADLASKLESLLP